MTSFAIPSHLACPACQRVTPLPSQTAPTSVVRCPHCRSQYALQDLLGDPEAEWELVSDAAPLCSSGDYRELPAESGDRAAAAGSELVDAGLQSEAGSQVAAGAQLPQAVSPGARTVEMSDYEVLLEGWSGEPATEQLPAEELAQNRVEEVVRKLEGPLVGEFYDDAEPEFEYSADSSWRSASQRAVQDQSSYVGAQGVSELGEPAGFQSFSNSPAVRRSRPRRSPLWSMLQVSLGGLAAIPVSLLLMWHVLGTDIGDAAPWVAQYAPWIVPSKFHAYVSPATLPADSGQTSGFAEPATALPRLPLPGPAVPAASLTAESEEVGDSADEIPTVQPRAISDIELGTDFLDPTTDPAIADFQIDDAFSVADTLVNSSLHAPDDLDSAVLENYYALIQETDSMLEEWSLAVSAKQHDMPLAQQTYGRLAALAMAVDKLPAREQVQQAIRGQLSPVGQQVEQKLEVRNLIDQGARFWIRSQTELLAEAGQESTAALGTTSSGEDRYGLAVTAVVDSVTSSDDGQWSMVTASATTPASSSGQANKAAKLPLQLKIPQELIDSLPQGQLSEGQRLFVLGTVSLPTEASDADAAASQPPVVANYLAPL